jgi:hypothetical protein
MKFFVKMDGLEAKDQLIYLDFTKVIIVKTDNDIPGSIRSIKISDKIYGYEGKTVYGKYIGDSRIDGFQMFKIDTLHLDREEKIDDILG